MKMLKLFFLHKITFWTSYKKKVKEFKPSQELNSQPLDYKSDDISTELLGPTSEKTQYSKTNLNYILFTHGLILPMGGL